MSDNSIPPPHSPREERNNADDATRMPLWEHLDELRKCLIRSLLMIGLAFIITYNFSDVIIRFLERPLLDVLPDGKLHYTGIADKFFVYFKVSVMAAVALVSPYLLWEAWRFISPALYRNERKFVLPFLILGSATFFLGLAFAYYLVIPYSYKFLLEFGGGDEQAIITLTEYFSLTSKLMIALGLVFEVPVLLILLAKFGIVSSDLLEKNRRFAFVVSSVVSAIATPSPDAFTMLLVMVPLYLLFEGSIIGVRWVEKMDRAADPDDSQSSEPLT